MLVNLCFLRGKGEHIFREWYGQLRQLSALIPSSIPFLCLTATATQAMQNPIVKDLQLKDFVQTWNWLSCGSAKT